ncbi:small membrane A-kinase anchor protein-like [Paramormyrops kingsleyae]|uniref:Small membrane A-kinase anchor protein n=1 Tax=Paramormyrops kingsleyae TaxID=1676925 RepID=A0A3B3T1P3_9TELE
MGCVKSKQSKPARHLSPAVQKVDSISVTVAVKGAVLPCSEAQPGGEPPQVSPILLDYAHRLSEEIIARAVQHWFELDRCYSDIPYIDLP